MTNTVAWTRIPRWRQHIFLGAAAGFCKVQQRLARIAPIHSKPDAGHPWYCLSTLQRITKNATRNKAHMLFGRQHSSSGLHIDVKKQWTLRARFWTCSMAAGGRGVVRCGGATRHCGTTGPNHRLLYILLPSHIALPNNCLLCNFIALNVVECCWFGSVWWYAKLCFLAKPVKLYSQRYVWMKSDVVQRVENQQNARLCPGEFIADTCSAKRFVFMLTRSCWCLHA